MCGMRVQSNKINLDAGRINTKQIPTASLSCMVMKWKLSPIASAAAAAYFYECGSGVCNSAKEVVFMMKMMVVGWWCQPNYNKWARLLTTVSVSKKKSLSLPKKLTILRCRLWLRCCPDRFNTEFCLQMTELLLCKAVNGWIPWFCVLPAAEFSKWGKQIENETLSFKK